MLDVATAAIQLLRTIKLNIKGPLFSWDKGNKRGHLKWCLLLLRGRLPAQASLGGHRDPGHSWLQGGCQMAHNSSVSKGARNATWALSVTVGRCSSGRGPEGNNGG